MRIGGKFSFTPELYFGGEAWSTTNILQKMFGDF